MSEGGKISEQHRRRRAVVHVRQSTLQQVERNVESSARQYALRERAIELGWPAASLVVVDEDTGRSGSSTEGRIGFKELVAEVGLGHVGLVLALEVSRFARSSADWHQLTSDSPRFELVEEELKALRPRSTLTWYGGLECKLPARAPRPVASVEL
jgi:hypothetical protein